VEGHGFQPCRKDIGNDQALAAGVLLTRRRPAWTPRTPIIARLGKTNMDILIEWVEPGLLGADFAVRYPCHPCPFAGI
jgi:hypothetical protein